MHECPINGERLLATFFEFARINSPSRHEGEMAQRVTELLQDLGIEVFIDDAGKKLGGETGNLIARLPGTIDAPPLLFCAHIDTVEPTSALQIQRHDDATITSDGATILGADDKAGVAAIIEMLRSLLASGVPRPPLELVFTIAEEVGLMGSTVLDYSRITATHGFVPDSSGNVGIIVTRAPAQKHLHVAIHGRAAHAGMAPEEGINAITVASRAIANMQQGRIDAETTANIGTIHGGKATNIVPDTVIIEGEARSRDPQKLEQQITHMRDCFLRASEQMGATAEVEITDVYPAFNLDENCASVQLAKEALGVLEITPIVQATGGGSDANFLNGHGVQTVILSAGYFHPHGTNETLIISDFMKLAQWLYHIVRLAGEGAVKG